MTNKIIKKPKERTKMMHQCQEWPWNAIAMQRPPPDKIGAQVADKRSVFLHDANKLVHVPPVRGR